MNAAASGSEIEGRCFQSTLDGPLRERAILLEQQGCGSSYVWCSHRSSAEVVVAELSVNLVGSEHPRTRSGDVELLSCFFASREVTDIEIVGARGIEYIEGMSG
jgi:hypothetical protein